MRTSSVAAISVGVLVLVIGGAVFERIGERRDRRKYPQIGTSVDIGGRTLNLYCSGTGSPTVVFETFSHMAGYAWSGLQRETAKLTRACWYDRAGYGWSEPGPRPATFKSTAEDLHALVRGAGIPTPFVFVGIGEAALEARVYHGLYPADIGGIVFVNGIGVDDFQDVPEAAKGPWARHFGSFAPRVRGAACVAFPVMADIGILRLFNQPRGTPAFDTPADQQAELDFLSDNPTASIGGGACNREEGMDEVRAAGNLGEVPLIVLATHRKMTADNPREQAIADTWAKHQDERVQPGLAALSTRGRLVFADGAVTPDAILTAVRGLLTAGSRGQ